MNRSEMRENAFKVIYSLEIQKPEKIEEQLELFYESNEIEDDETKKYISDVIFGINKNEEQILNVMLQHIRERIEISC